MAKFGNVRFQALRLTEAREFSALSKRELAKLASCSEQSISNYERGISNPTEIVLYRLSDVLGVPVEFFLRPAWPEEVREVFWRAMSSDPVHSKRRTGVLLRWVLESIDRIEEYVEFPPFEMPVKLVLDWRRTSPNLIEEIAESIRTAWGFGRQPVPNVCLALENAGIPVIVFRAENRKQAGFAYNSKILERPVVGVNIYEQGWARQRFSLAHELGHLILHRAVSIDEMKSLDANRHIERQAHRFASAFLFPRSSFERELYDFSLEEFSSLKRTWGISIVSQIIRARDLNLISDEHAQSLFRSAGRRGYRRPNGEPWDLELPLEDAKLLQRAIHLIASEGSSMMDNYTGSMCLPLRHLELSYGYTFRSALEEMPSNVVKLRPRAS